MLIQNKSNRPIQHSEYSKDFKLKIIEIKAGEVKEIEDSIAQKWLKSGLVTEYVEPKAAKEKETELLKEIEKLKAENKKLKEDKPKAAKTKK